MVGNYWQPSFSNDGMVSIHHQSLNRNNLVFCLIVTKRGEPLHIPNPRLCYKKIVEMSILESTIFYRIFSVCQDIPLHDSGGSSKGDDGHKRRENKEKLRQHDSSAIVTRFYISLHPQTPEIGPLCRDWRLVIEVRVNGPPLS